MIDCSSIHYYRYVCAYALNSNGTGGWSTDGIEIVNIAEINEYGYRVICNSSHVTPFTVLVNIHQVEVRFNMNV